VRKTEGALQERAFRAAKILLGINAATAAVYFSVMAGAFDGLSGNMLFHAAWLMTLAGLAGLFFSLRKKNDRAPFWESSFAFAGLFLAAGAAQFPNLIRASNNPHLRLTIFNSSTGIYTLQVMAVIALVGLPIVIGYTIFVYACSRGRSEATITIENRSAGCADIRSAIFFEIRRAHPRRSIAASGCRLTGRQEHRVLTRRLRNRRSPGWCRLRSTFGAWGG
jgi:cytochrome bd-type quinol oxidase subunit 2